MLRKTNTTTIDWFNLLIIQRSLTDSEYKVLLKVRQQNKSPCSELVDIGQ